MHSYTKSELAQAAGVSVDTLRRWLQTDAEYLRLCRQYNIRKNAKLLPPQVVAYISAHYCIDLL